MKRTIILLLVFFTCVLLNGWAQEPKIITFDFPGAKNTVAIQINDLGTIVGYYWSGNPVSYHGFVRDPTGKFTTIDAPGAGPEGTYATGVNGVGTTAGRFADSNGVYHGFVRTSGGKFTTFDPPDAGTGYGQGVATIAINAAGEVYGDYTDSSGVSHGFMRPPHGKITSFDPTGSVSTWACFVGITPAGAVTGYYNDSSTTHGFVRSPDGTITSFDVPGADGTMPMMITPLGTIPGIYWTSDGVTHSFVRDPWGKLTTIEAPGF